MDAEVRGRRWKHNFSGQQAGGYFSRWHPPVPSNTGAAPSMRELNRAVFSALGFHESVVFGFGSPAVPSPPENRFPTGPFLWAASVLPARPENRVGGFENSR